MCMEPHYYADDTVLYIAVDLPKQMHFTIYSPLLVSDFVLFCPFMLPSWPGLPRKIGYQPQWDFLGEIKVR